MNRIFISYRSADGAKDASRLAEDLGAVFGAERVFLDREDLRGGSRWRAEIGRAIGHRPVVLLLVTPAFAGACHPDGRLRIDDADDPVRCEIESAIEAGAVIMPLRIDGTTMPAADRLPGSLRVITEQHALPLRTDDWVRVDLPRIVADIERLGVPRADPARASASQPGGRTRRVVGGAVLLSLMVLLGVLLADRTVPSPAPGASPASAAAGSLDGSWVLRTGAGKKIPLHIRDEAGRLELRSEPVRVDDDPAWTAYVESLAKSQGTTLTHVRYTAKGEVFGSEADLALIIASADGSFVVDSGNLHLGIHPDRAGFAGRMILNSGEAAAVTLVRSP